MSQAFKVSGGEFKWSLVGLFGKALVDALFATTRIEYEGRQKVTPLLESKRFILAFWHSRILMFSYLYQGWGGAILVSASTDGEYIARVLQRQGHRPIRGSTSKGGARALTEQIRCIQRTSSTPGVVVPDGPQGPRFRVQPGVILLAKKTGYPILPVSYSAKRAKVFSSWDRFMLPFPFTTCRVVYGDPVIVAPDAKTILLEERRKTLEQELRRITFETDKRFGHSVD